MRKLLFLTAFLITATTTFTYSPATIHTLKRVDATDCHYYFDVPAEGTFPIMLLLHGSETESVTYFMGIANGPLLPKMNMALLGVEKPGVTTTTFDKDVYFKSNSLVQRAHDCCMVIDYMRKNEPRWNGKLVLCGGSEGATLAAYLSTMIPEIKAIIMFSGGCGMSLRDELLVLEDKIPSSTIKDSCEKWLAKVHIKAMLNVVKLFPHSSYTCLGETNTFKYWNSIADYNPLTSLEQVSFPLYLAHGSSDVNCPVESADVLARYFKALGKDNLHYRRYEGLDHCFNDAHGTNYFGEVSDEAFAWLGSVKIF